MQKSWTFLAALTILVAGGLIGEYIWLKQRWEGEIEYVSGFEPTTSPLPTATPCNIIKLPIYYFSPATATLQPVMRSFMSGQNLEELTTATLLALFTPPSEPNLVSPIPKGTKLLGVFWVKEESTLYLNFSRDLVDKHPGGFLAEWATIYAIANTAAVDQQIKYIRILCNGEELETLKGDWDVSGYFMPDRETYVGEEVSE